MRRALLAVALAASTALSACSGDEPAQIAPPEPQVSAEPAWNPCSGLDIETVTELFGTTYTTRLGTAEAPVCTFAPQTDGEPVVDVNYQTFPGSLGELLKTFGQTEVPGRTQVTTPDVEGADDVRLIIDGNDGTFVATAFVRNGLLVQILNVLDLAPYDRRELLRGVDVLMADLAANAGTSGLTR